MVAVSEPAKRSSLGGALKVRVWPLAIQMVVLSVGLCAAAIVALTVMGYRSATKGLKTEVEAALAADGRVVTDAVDTYNDRQFVDEQTFASIPVVQNLLIPGQTAQLSDLLSIQGLATTATSTRGGIGSVAAATLARPDGSVIIDSRVGEARTTQAPVEAFRNALTGQASVSGVSI